MEVSEDNMELEDGFSNGNDSKEAELSALKANIIQKGKNSYYYAHGHKADGPAWDGKEEPRLLKVDSIDSTASSSKKVKYLIILKMIFDLYIYIYIYIF